MLFEDVETTTQMLFEDASPGTLQSIRFKWYAVKFDLRHSDTSTYKSPIEKEDYSSEVPPYSYSSIREEKKEG